MERERIIPVQTESEENYFDMSNEEFEGLVGIPAHNFRSILKTHITGELFITLTSTQVRLTTATRSILLALQDNQCFIGGLNDEDEIELSVDLESVKSSWVYALQHTEMVWVLTSEAGFDAISFPYWPLGNLLYFLGAGEEDDEDTLFFHEQ